MRILYIIFILFIFSMCQPRKNGFNAGLEQFYCNNKAVEGRAFFVKMKNIKYFKNLSTGKFEKRRVGISNETEFDTIFNCYVHPIIFEIEQFHSTNKDYYNNVVLRNDSLFLLDSKRIFNLFSFEKGFERNNHFCHISMDKYYFDRKCGDTVYVFKYLFYPMESHSNIDSTGLREIWASRERGILKVVYKDSIGDIWEGKHYPELDTLQE